MEKTACTFIGSDLQRFSFGYDFTHPKCTALKIQISQYINDMYKSGIKEFYSICEQGVDLWAAEIVTFLMRDDEDVELHCILPYEEQAAKWHPDTRELYYNVLAKATDAEFVSLSYTEDCYEDARHQTLDNSGWVFAVVEEGANDVFVKYARQSGGKVCVM